MTQLQYIRAKNVLEHLIAKQANQHNVLAHDHATFRFELSFRTGDSLTGEINIEIVRSGERIHHTKLHYHIRKDKVMIRDEHEQELATEKVLKCILLHAPPLAKPKQIYNS